MNITLPNNFEYKGKGYYATIEDEILKMRGKIFYEQLMYSLAYKIHQEKVCSYCRNRCDGKCTIDHIYPRCMGGISITNNMVVSCPECNVSKDFLTQEEYNVFLKLPESEREGYKKSVVTKNERIKRKNGFKLPKEWITTQKAEDIICKNQKALKEKGKQYKSIEKFYRKYNRFPRPIIVDKNNKLVDGIAVYCFALNNNERFASTIILENVEVIE